jgi:hypothetical protein
MPHYECKRTQTGHNPTQSQPRATSNDLTQPFTDTCARFVAASLPRIPLCITFSTSKNNHSLPLSSHTSGHSKTHCCRKNASQITAPSMRHCLCWARRLSCHANDTVKLPIACPGALEKGFTNLTGHRTFASTTTCQCALVHACCFRVGLAGLGMTELSGGGQTDTAHPT